MLEVPSNELLDPGPILVSVWKKTFSLDHPALHYDPCSLIHLGFSFLPKAQLID
jgi:hypothetical protein